MLPKPARVRTNAEFDRIFRRGRSRYGRHLGVRAAEPGGFGVAQTGFIVGRKTAPLATDRNRLKRRLRAIVRERSAALRPAAIAVVTKPGAAGCSYQELDDELTGLLLTLKLLKE